MTDIRTVSDLFKYFYSRSPTHYEENTIHRALKIYEIYDLKNPMVWLIMQQARSSNIVEKQAAMNAALLKKTESKFNTYIERIDLRTKNHIEQTVNDLIKAGLDSGEITFRKSLNKKMEDYILKVSKKARDKGAEEGGSLENKILLIFLVLLSMFGGASILFIIQKHGNEIYDWFSAYI